MSSCPIRRAASSASPICDAVVGSLGLMRYAITVAAGTSSRSNPICLAPSNRWKLVTPVAFPPGRLRLATKPVCTGSAPTLKTIGIVLVASVAAFAESSPPLVTMMETCRRTNSSASFCARSYSPSPS